MPEKDSILLIKKYLDEYNSVEEVVSIDKVYSEKIKLGDNEYNVGGIFFNDNPNLIANYIFSNKSYVLDILLLINIEKNIVILRKKEDGININLSKLAKQLSKGGGKHNIAGCILNDKIINLTKLLKPYNE
jgi:hypothetical protein|tara:strand:+ start:610 stop:1002 length:393 start_codon:yes stop_codon:yes gene_type:complete